MMRLLRRLRRDDRGAAVIETAFALPALILMMWMLVQAGLVFRAMITSDGIGGNTVSRNIRKPTPR